MGKASKLKLENIKKANELLDITQNNRNKFLDLVKT